MKGIGIGAGVIIRPSVRATEQGNPARTRVATLFPNEACCLRLASAVAMEISEEWETNRIYLTVS